MKTIERIQFPKNLEELGVKPLHLCCFPFAFVPLCDLSHIFQSEILGFCGESANDYTYTAT